MTKKFLIIVADRNPRIRGYLSRELSMEGYHVFPVKTLAQLRNWIFSHHPLDLLILDPSLSEDDSGEDLEKLLRKTPSVPVIFHCLHTDYPTFKDQRFHPVFVEKSGTSVITLKQNIHSLIHDVSRG
jgi:DNA-binding NtrC family response regulator